MEKETKAWYLDLVKGETRPIPAVNNKQKEIEDRKKQEKIKIMEHHNKVEDERIKNYRNCIWIMKQRKQLKCMNMKR